MDRTIRLLTDRRALLEKTARRLLEKETLDESELLQLVSADEPRLADRADRTVVDLERERQGHSGSSEAAQERDGMRS